MLGKALLVLGSSLWLLPNRTFGPTDITVLLNAPIKDGRSLIRRGEQYEITSGQLNSGPEGNNLRIIGKIKAIGPNGQTTTTALEKVFWERNEFEHENKVKFWAPSDLKSGPYDLEIEAVGIGKTRRKITLLDPFVKIREFYPPNKVGDEITCDVNFVPPDCRILVKRIHKAMIHDVWWSEHKSFGAQSAVLLPKVSKKSGSFRLEAKLPATMGAGEFEARVQGTAKDSVSETKTFKFDFPKVRPPEYTFRYDGLMSIVDSDEPGSDELYPVFGIAKNYIDHEKKGAYWYELVMGPLIDVSKGETKYRPKEICKYGTSYYVGFAMAVVLMEHDNSDIAAIERAAQKHMSSSRGDGKILAGLMVDNIKHQNSSEPGTNTDDIVEAKEFPITWTELREISKVKGWHKKNFTFTGSGGRFNLRFSIKAEPDYRNANPTKKP